MPICGIYRKVFRGGIGLLYEVSILIVGKSEKVVHSEVTMWTILLCFPSTTPYVVTNVITNVFLVFVAIRNNPSRSRMFPGH